MGCASSKRVQGTIDAYRPPPSSFAVFDINAVKEPWLMVDAAPEEAEEQQDEEKKAYSKSPTSLPILPTILDKLETTDTTPQTWEEVSKALETHLKPTIKGFTATKSQSQLASTTTSVATTPSPKHVTERRVPRKSFSFHTLEELDENRKPSNDLRRTESSRTELTEFKSENNVFGPRISPKPKPANEFKKTESTHNELDNSNNPSFKSVRENIFILRDRSENKEKPGFKRETPLSEFPEICPPGGSDAVVLYTTSLRGIRRTYEDCARVKSLMEGHRVVFDERDVSLHGEFLNELKSLLGEGVSVPRVFVKGRYVGGVEEVSELNEWGRLGRVLNYARVERGVGRQACEGCGGGRFVPCLDCGGSCKVFIDGDKERCLKCNENGLVHCPLCVNLK